MIYEDGGPKPTLDLHKLRLIKDFYFTTVKPGLEFLVELLKICYIKAGLTFYS